MKARMEKYDTSTGMKKRTQKNENLYNEVQNMNIDYVDINIDNAMDLSLSDDSKYSRENFQRQREIDSLMSKSKSMKSVSSYEDTPDENRVYDIDQILKMAKDNKLFEEETKKRLINTEYNILTKLDVKSLQNEDMKKEDLRSLIDNIYEKEKPVKEKTYSRKEEDRLLSDLFDDTPSDDEFVLKEELSKQILDNADEDVKNESDLKEVKELDKKDNKNTEEKESEDIVAEDDFGIEKEGNGLLIAIIVVIILILLTCGFFVYEYFFGL